MLDWRFGRRWHSFTVFIVLLVFVRVNSRADGCGLLSREQKLVVYLQQLADGLQAEPHVVSALDACQPLALVVGGVLEADDVVAGALGNELEDLVAVVGAVDKGLENGLVD